MTTLYLGFASILLLTIVGGLVRVVRGPTPPDRMLAAQLFGSTGVSVLLLMGHGMGQPVLYDVALVFALLAGVAVVAFIRRAWQPSREHEATHES